MIIDNDPHREFLFEFADYQLAYEKGRVVDGNGKAIPDPAGVINPPVKDEVGLPFLVENPRFVRTALRRHVRKQFQQPTQAR